MTPTRWPASSTSSSSAPPQKRSVSISAGGSLNDRARRLGDKLTAGFGDQLGPLGLQAGGTRNDEFRGKDKTVSDAARNETESETELVRTLTTSGLLDLELRLGERDRLSVHPLLSDQTESKDKDRLVRNRLTGANKSLNREREVKYATLDSFGADWEHRFLGGSVLKLEGSWAINEENKEKKTAQFTGAALPFTKNLFEDERKQDRERTAAVELKSPWSGPWRTEHAFSTGLKWRDKDRRVNKSNWEINPAGVRTNKTVADDSYRVDETIAAAFIMDEASLTEKLVLTPGVRVEATDGGYRSGGGRSARGDFVDWSPSIHALYRLRDALQARASVGRTISRPAFRDKVPTRSVKSDKVEEGNPDLDAARSTNVEAGLERYLGKNGLIAAGGFYKRIDAVIEKQTIGIDGTTGLPLVRPRNAGAADVVGAELEAKTTLELLGLPEATVLANYTRQYAHVKDAATGQRRRLKDNPENLANLIGRWDGAKSGFSATVGLNYIGEMVDETAAPTKVTAPFLQWDASVKQRLGRGISVFASALNLFDELKVKDDGLRREEERAGRTFYFGLSMEF